MSHLFVDTSAWLDHFNKTAPDHGRVRALLEAPEHELVTSNFVVDEMLNLLLSRQGHRTALEAGRQLWAGALAMLVRVEPQDEETAWEHFQACRGPSFTDCTSFAVMRRLRLTTAATLDSDFRRAGFAVLP